MESKQMTVGLIESREGGGRSNFGPEEFIFIELLESKVFSEAPVYTA
jgi:hypothetical protein